MADSLVSSHSYEIIKTIYSTPTDNGEDARVPVLQQTLSQLRLANIATLDACMNHFTRLIELTSADEQYIQELATALAPCILRPRQETSLTMEEKHAYRLVRDLLAHKTAIFSELKRMSSLNHSGSVSSARPRAISTDESNRRAHMEERQRALLEKSGGRGRATSPAPSPRHRRDRSAGGPETRFPIKQTSPTTATTAHERHRSSLGSQLTNRQSLEVPDGMSTPPLLETNGLANGAGDGHGHHEGGVAKRDSLGRSGARFVGGRRVTVGSNASTPTSGGTPTTTKSSSIDEALAEDRGVTLVDAPMDD